MYDLDGVITTKDTFASMLTRRLLASPWRLVRARTAVMSWARSTQTEDKAAAAREITEITLSGMGHSEYVAHVEALGARLGGDPRWVRSSTVDRIKRQYESGARIVIATATEETLASALLKRAQVPHHNLSASQVAEQHGGVAIVDHRIVQRKADALLEAGVPMQNAEFVTDSMADLPTARLARHVVIIGASARTHREYSEARHLAT
ncbi:haloacid dehalogenase-like hydrolase [Leucobacter sp. wl10]|uniref:haloacid dehalogenase-like hydrolase n=1 Tax=Leucobacter sp. wl10 TaxID=2304677 RepID=UPI0013C2C09D|nr:haloacid dehalogenase-like hydrolase [Leucobacter sp. wl10]